MMLERRTCGTAARTDIRHENVTAVTVADTYASLRCWRTRPLRPTRLGVSMSMRNRSQWALRLLALAAAVAMASPVLAQNSPLGQKPNTPSAPFQEKGAGSRTSRRGDATRPDRRS
jgi:hypothetical protein